MWALEERLEFNQDPFLTNGTLYSASVTSEIVLGDHNTFSYKMTVRVPLHDMLLCNCQGSFQIQGFCCEDEGGAEELNIPGGYLYLKDDGMSEV